MKIIIITRDGEYEGSTAMEHYSKGTPSGGKFITDYITNYFKELLIKDRDFLKGIPITLINSSDLTQYANECRFEAKRKKDVGYDYKGYMQKYWNDKFEEIICPKLEDLLALKDDAHRNCPYVRFTLGRKDVNFVFLNRIFDQFTDNDYHKYNLLIEKDRFGFIKAVCQDCEILDETGNLKTSDGGNYLYIHDKEWGCNGEKMIKSEYYGWRENIEDATLKKLLEDCFSKIIVFMHTLSKYHNSIKDLSFLTAVEKIEQEESNEDYL